LKVREIASYPGLLTTDEDWVYHFEPETERQSMEWHHLQSPWRGEFKTSPLAGQSWSVFRDCERDNSDAYIRTLTELTKLFKHVTDSGHHHKIWWDNVNPSTLQPHPLSSDFNQFGALKNAIRGTKCEAVDDVVHTVKTWLYEQNEAWN
jgi:hypothetical protein